MIEIRKELPGDVDAIRDILLRAFPGDGEARLVEAMRASGALFLSLVAEEAGRVVGHVAFSDVRVDGHAPNPPPVGLAPVAVHPDAQGSGVGQRLIREGIRIMCEAGRPFMVVLGEPEYYHRFGFQTAARHGLRCEYPAPEDAFMVMELRTGGLSGLSGLVRYCEEFGAL